MIILKRPIKLAADNFCHQADYYLLSHYHSDHMAGLDQYWANGIIICSSITAELLKYELRISALDIMIIDKDQSIEIDGVNITAMDANHCPGAMLFFIRTAKQKHIYTGDFRYCKNIHKPRNLFSGTHTLYLDTTFENTDYRFPTQEEAISQVIKIIQDNPEKKIIIAVYKIGKNKLLELVSKATNKKIYVSAQKAAVYQLLGQGDIITTNKQETNIYAYSRFYLESYFRKKEDEIVIMPTGMISMDRYARRYKDFIFIPYSEHCSAYELVEFKKMVKAENIISII